MQPFYPRPNPSSAGEKSFADVRKAAKDVVRQSVNEKIQAENASKEIIKIEAEISSLEKQLQKLQVENAALLSLHKTAIGRSETINLQNEKVKNILTITTDACSAAEKKLGSLCMRNELLEKSVALIQQRIQAIEPTLVVIAECSLMGFEDQREMIQKDIAELKMQIENLQENINCCKDESRQIEERQDELDMKQEEERRNILEILEEFKNSNEQIELLQKDLNAKNEDQEQLIKDNQIIQQFILIAQEDENWEKKKYQQEKEDEEWKREEEEYQKEIDQMKLDHDTNENVNKNAIEERKMEEERVMRQIIQLENDLKRRTELEAALEKGQSDAYNSASKAVADQRIELEKEELEKNKVMEEGELRKKEIENEIENERRNKLKEIQKISKKKKKRRKKIIEQKEQMENTIKEIKDGKRDQEIHSKANYEKTGQVKEEFQRQSNNTLNIRDELSSKESEYKNKCEQLEIAKKQLEEKLKQQKLQQENEKKSEKEKINTEMIKDDRTQSFQYNSKKNEKQSQLQIENNEIGTQKPKKRTRIEKEKEEKEYSEQISNESQNIEDDQKEEKEEKFSENEDKEEDYSEDDKQDSDFDDQQMRKRKTSETRKFGRGESRNQSNGRKVQKNKNAGQQKQTVEKKNRTNSGQNQDINKFNQDKSEKQKPGQKPDLTNMKKENAAYKGTVKVSGSAQKQILQRRLYQEPSILKNSSINATSVKGSYKMIIDDEDPFTFSSAINGKSLPFSNTFSTTNTSIMTSTYQSSSSSSLAQSRKIGNKHQKVFGVDMDTGTGEELFSSDLFRTEE
ncbi:MAG: hypothetical protein EZS28_007290 [Streblomastix strix]|uniref:Uncharacterized protein n=1 Tax=Streblomastix strix TaxID=222440 RepID=A0A5J4WQF0_9EUKA|nr:MAG: hypothetical protein EZS28_007290 [Streblomastix strix]